MGNGMGTGGKRDGNWWEISNNILSGRERLDEEYVLRLLNGFNGLCPSQIGFCGSLSGFSGSLGTLWQGPIPGGRVGTSSAEASTVLQPLL